MCLREYMSHVNRYLRMPEESNKSPVGSCLMSVLRSKLEPSAEAASVHHWAVSPAPPYYHYCAVFSLLYTRFTARSWEGRVTLTHLPTLKEGKPLTHCLKFSQSWPLSLVLPKLFYPVIPKLNASPSLAWWSGSLDHKQALMTVSECSSPFGNFLYTNSQEWDHQARGCGLLMTLDVDSQIALQRGCS